MLARSTAKGEAVVEKSIAENKLRLGAAFIALSANERTTLIALLGRFRDAYQIGDETAKMKSGAR